MKMHIAKLHKTVPFLPFFTLALTVERSALSALSLFLSAACLVPALRADTVALWKLDYEGDGAALNTRCLLDPANDLTPSGTLWKGAAVDAWQDLPPNPDASTNMLASAKNQNAVGLSPSSSYLTSTTFGSRVNVTNSFTVEGWWNLSANPTGTGWFYLVGAHTGGAGRWILSLRNGGTNWILYVDSQINDTAFPVKNDPAATNVWRHLALTYDRNAGSAQQGVWELFVDSQSYGALTNSSRPATLSTADSAFFLGGRVGSNTGLEKLDYWRVSDAALTSNAFLNAGVATPEPETLPRTSFYWRLDGAADGVMDTRDFVGGARLSGSLDITNHTTAIQAAAGQAFDGQPPNSADALPSGNAGSAYAQASGACMRVPDLGAQLEITNSFTVEGWLCPHRQDYDADVQYIANTRITTKGWAFGLKKQSDSTRKLVIFAEDDAGVLAGDAPLSADLSTWADTWKHVALVYDATAGALAQGVWSCYLDGVLQGSVTNSRARSGDSSSSYFHLAGRVGNGGCFCGYLDCWRACKAALAPNQFMNATNGAAAATGVLALWPLNSADGVYLDAADVVGTYSFNTPMASLYKVTASTEQATANVPNPDATAAFRGDPAANFGSIIFNTPTETASKAYLSSTDITLRETLCLTNSFTWEGWFYRTKNPGNWQILFGTGSAPTFTPSGMTINMTYRSNGYVLFVNDGTSQINDVAFPGTTDDKTLNAWRHLALVYDASVTNGIWTFYVDGISQGTLTNSTAQKRSLPGGVYVGGRPWSANSFYGMIDTLRLTKGVLATNQFLNAAVTPPVPVAPQTVAYWKLDSDGATLNASSQVEPRYSFIPDAYVPAGSTAQFKRFVPVPDTSASFIGDPRANAGSAAFTADYLRIQNLGYRVELDRAFTVEGWMFWSNQTAVAVQTLAGTRFDSDYGWRLTLNTNGVTATFGLFCQAPGRTPVLNTSFPYEAAALAGGWHHLALTYTPRRNDTGAWELFVDGTSAGTASNLFYPTTLQQSHWFMLGGRSGGTEAFDGLLDCWRVSEGALTPDQFLYLGYGTGTILLLQ
jgi:hypothetical protein